MHDKAVVIAAWGTDKRFADLKIQAMGNLRDMKVIGVKPETSWMYYDFRYIKPPTYQGQKEMIQMLVERYVNYIEKEKENRALENIRINEALGFFIQHKDECAGYKTCTEKNTVACPCKDVMINTKNEKDRALYKKVREVLKEYVDYRKAREEKIDFTPKVVKKCKTCGGKDMIYSIQKFENGGEHYIAWCNICCKKVDAVTQPQNENKRANSAHSNWAAKVYERDGYRCFICGSTKGIEAHHIIPYAYDEKLQSDYEECAGITLCKEHHNDIKITYNNFRRTGSYGKKNNQN